MKKIRILLVDDHKILRDGICSLLKQYPDMEVVGESADGKLALRLVKELSPDIVIMDISMPELNGIEATRRILLEYPHVKVMALSMHYEKHFISEIFKAGASGYLLKDCAFDEMAHAIRIVIDNKTYIPPQIASLLVESLVNNSTSVHNKHAITLLTEREKEVLKLIAEGKSTKQIAAHLNVSSKTIESHRRQVMAKLNIRNVADLTKYSIREGLISI